jgi:hypothetical protein
MQWGCLTWKLYLTIYFPQLWSVLSSHIVKKKHTFTAQHLCSNVPLTFKQLLVVYTVPLKGISSNSSDFSAYVRSMHYSVTSSVDSDNNYIPNGFTSDLELVACSTLRVAWDMWVEKAVQNYRLWSLSLWHVVRRMVICPCNRKAAGSLEILIIVTVLKPELYIFVVKFMCIFPVV